MAGKPRVHEVASELGVDLKVALKVLRELGEFVKSPSSTIEAPTARRLRAALRGDPIPATSRHAAMPPIRPRPNARWTVAMIAQNLQTDVRSVIAVLATNNVRGTTANSALTAEQESLLRRTFAPDPRRDVDTHRQADVQDIPEIVPVPSHPEGAWAAVRLNLIRRSERDWSRFGITQSRKNLWLRSGIPEDRAHVAALLNSGSNVAPSALDTVLSSGQTLRREALSGVNAVRLRQRLALKQGTQLTGVRDDLVSILGKPGRGRFDAETDEYRARLHAIRIAPSSLPELTDAAVAYLASATRVDAAHLRLGSAARAYLADKTVDPLLSDVAQAHGVTTTGIELTTLAEAAVAYVESTRRAQRVSAAVLFRAAASERRFMFVDADIAELLDDAPGERKLPPTPSGVAYLHHSDQPDRILVWTSLPTGIHVALFDGRALTAKGSLPPVDLYSDASTSPSAGMLRALTRLRTPALGGTSHRGEPAWRHLEPEDSTGGDAQLKAVVLHYRSERGESSTEPRSSRRPDHRWEVRGHSRRQWYPSQRAHHVIWIDDHTAGPAHRPLVRVDRVEVF